MKQHDRNTKGLLQSAKKRSAAAYQRADAAISRLAHEGRRINFQSVSKEGAVSHGFLYQHPELKARIEHLRAQEGSSRVPAPRIPPRERASDASKERIIATLREELRREREEKQELKRQLEIAYGQIYAKELNTE